MKSLAAVALVITSVAAQNASISHVIQYYSSCATTATENAPSMQAFTGAPALRTGEVLTSYTTVYEEFCTCSETFTLKTYTVTEPCPSASAGQPRESNYVPSGFAVTTATCSVCAATPITATLTTPVPQATVANKAGVAQPPSPTSPPSNPGAPVSPGSNAAPAPGAAAPGAAAPGLNAAPAPGSSSSGSNAAAPGVAQPPFPVSGLAPACASLTVYLLARSTTNLNV